MNNMSEEKKELTIEEMRALISLDTLLPGLLNKIEEIEAKVKTLSGHITTLIGKFNDNVAQVEKYKQSVDSLIKKQLDAKEIENQLKQIKSSIARIEMTNSVPEITPSSKPINQAKKQSAKKVAEDKETKNEKEKTKEEPKVESYQSKSKDELDAIDYGTRLLANSRGRKTRTLTLVDVKKAFSIADASAQKVLDWLESKKVYNPKTHILTFKK